MVCMSVSAHARMCILMRVHMVYVCMYVHTCACVCICICVHIPVCVQQKDVPKMQHQCRH